MTRILNAALWLAQKIHPPFGEGDEPGYATEPPRDPETLGIVPNVRIAVSLVLFACHLRMLPKSMIAEIDVEMESEGGIDPDNPVRMTRWQHWKSKLSTVVFAWPAVIALPKPERKDMLRQALHDDAEAPERFSPADENPE